jgi:hypothetical protein
VLPRRRIVVDLSTTPWIILARMAVSTRTTAATLSGPGARRRVLAAGVLVAALCSPAAAHPNENAAYSMRTLVRMSDDELRVVVVLEAPIAAVTEEFGRRYIEPGVADPDDIGQEHVDEFNRLQWNRLASGLRLTVGGRAPEGSWVPADTPVNGRANAGFFVYLLWFRMDPSERLPVGEVVVEVENGSFRDVPMYLSGYADTKGSWSVAANSARDILGDGALVREAATNPGSWTVDPAMRRLRVVFRQPPVTDR